LSLCNIQQSEDGLIRAETCNCKYFLINRCCVRHIFVGLFVCTTKRDERHPGNTDVGTEQGLLSVSRYSGVGIISVLTAKGLGCLNVSSWLIKLHVRDINNTVTIRYEWNGPIEKSRRVWKDDTARRQFYHIYE